MPECRARSKASCDLKTKRGDKETKREGMNSVYFFKTNSLTAALSVLCAVMNIVCIHPFE